MSSVEFPKEWCLTNLGSIVELKYGRSLTASKRDGGKFPVYGSNGVVGGHSEPLVEKEGIIVGRKGSCGEVQLSDFPFFPIDTTYYIDELFSQPLKYWFYQLKFLPLTELNRSTAIPGLNREDAYSQDIALPPLAEQKVIADKLDILLEQVEKTKSRLERISEILKTFRQSILAAAVIGKLTEEWREENHFIISYPNKGKEKYKQELFDSASQLLPDLPKEWIVIPAASTLEYVTSGSRGWAKYYADNGALFLRMSNVSYDTTRLDFSDLQYVKLPESVEGKRSLVRMNDLVISITADVGRVARVSMELDEVYVNQHLALVRPSNDINSEYLATCIAAVNVGVKQVQAFKRGATKAGLRLDDIRSLAIPFPAIEEQVEIVRRVAKLFAFADGIEQRTKVALERVNNLTQSILATAFRGELTTEWRADNLDLISDDNSAEILLEKIKVEREAIEIKSKKKNPIIKKTGSRMSKQIVKVVKVLKKTGQPLSGQQLLAAAGYPSDSSTDQLEQFFLDIRNALTIEKSIIKLKRGGDSQDWFALAEVAADE